MFENAKYTIYTSQFDNHLSTFLVGSYALILANIRSADFFINKSMFILEFNESHVKLPTRNGQACPYQVWTGSGRALCYKTFLTENPGFLPGFFRIFIVPSNPG